MKEFVFGDMFILFKNEFGIEEKDVFAAYYAFDRQQDLEAGAKIFIKEINKDQNRKHLLLCIRSVGQLEQFAFSYWVPDFILHRSNSPINILENFCKEFGCKIRVSKSFTGYFSFKAEFVAQVEEIYDPNDVVENLESIDIPCKTFFFYEKQEHHDNGCNDGNNSTGSSLFYIYYCFSINEFRYNGWLYDIPMTQMKVPKEWHSSLDEVTKLLNPLGGTQIKILKSGRNNSCFSDAVEIPNEETLDISLPKRYKGAFEYSIKLIKELREDEKVALVPVQKNQGCLFCGAVDEMSSEHVFPKWLRKYVKNITFHSSAFLDTPSGSNNVSECAESSFYDNKLDSTEKSTAHGFTVQEVCQACNNGWMSQLEEEAKNILVHNEQLVIADEMTFDSHQSYLLSLWLFKIWLLVLYKFPSQRVSMFMFRDLMLGKLPEGLIIETSQAINDGIGSTIVLGNSDFIVLKPKMIALEDAKKFAMDFISCTLHIGRNFFRISYLPPGNPLTRKSSVKKTKVIFPYNHRLELVVIDKERENDILGGAEPGVELFIFSIMIILV
ncbi:MAG: hypothetical protein KME47_21440 [Nodosilinea sp. WJT8-NPBG4]|nr:hypothetical protein [Nodosilinea sp. WJT8-NPBG4]